jgi:ABC-type glycerol-3-phosphate transport system substrate-binding protein
MVKNLAILAVITILVMAGCASPATPEPAAIPAQAATSGKTVLEFWHTMSGHNGEVLEEMVAKFNEEHPDIHVKSVFQGKYAVIAQKFWAAIQAGSVPPPDVAQIGGAPMFGATGALAPITDFTDGPEGIDRAEIYDAFWTYNTAGGKLWTMPFNNSMPVLYYNKDLFRAAGLDPEKPPETWDELVEAAQALTRDTDGDGQIDQWGFNTTSSTHWYLSAMILQNGGRIINDDETRVLYDGPEAVEALAFWGELVNVHKVMPPAQHAAAKGDFLAGKLGMLMQSSAGLPSALEEAPFEVGVGMLPAKKARVTPIGGASLVIVKGEEAKMNAAWEFTRWLTSPENSNYWAMNSGYVPTYKGALETTEMQQFLQENPLYKTVIEQLEYAYGIPVFSELGTSDTELRKAVEKVELGAATPEEALEAAAEAVNNALSEQ